MEKAPARFIAGGTGERLHASFISSCLSEIERDSSELRPRQFPL